MGHFLVLDELRPLATALGAGGRTALAAPATAPTAAEVSISPSTSFPGVAFFREVALGAAALPLALPVLGVRLAAAGPLSLTAVGWLATCAAAAVTAPT